MPIIHVSYLAKKKLPMNRDVRSNYNSDILNIPHKKVINISTKKECMKILRIN